MGALSGPEFDSIVQSVARDAYRVIDADTSGFHVRVTFRSQSGKSRWEAQYDFDAETGDYSYWENPHYPGSAQAWGFGNQVRERIKLAIYLQANMDTPRIGDIVRVGSGSTPWRVIDVSRISGFVLLASTETGIQRSELPSNLEPYDG